MPDTSQLLSKRVLEDRQLELVAEAAFTRGFVRVRRRDIRVKITERDVMLILRKAGVELTGEVRVCVAKGVAAVNTGLQIESTFLAAEGVHATPGRDAQLHWTVQPNARCWRATDGNAAADFRNLGDDGNVREGQLLLTVTPATRGTPGVDIFGETIRPRRGREANVRRGRNVGVSEDGTRYLARTNGRLSFRHNVVSVENVYEIHGSVDYSVGNVDFAGPVIIHGDVKAGFTVRSDEYIEIYGTVEGGHLFAKGDIKVRGGINGRGKGRIECGGSLNARYLNGATIEAGGGVEVVKSVVHSEVRCGGSFRVVTQGVRASRIIAGRNVDVPVVGSSRAVEVEISAGIDVTHQKGLEVADRAIEELAKERWKLRQALGGLVHEPARVVEVRPVEKRVRMAQMLGRYFAIEREQEEWDLRRDELQKQAREASQSKIKISRMLWRGVTLRITDVEHKVLRSRRGPVAYAPTGSRLVAT